MLWDSQFQVLSAVEVIPCAEMSIESKDLAERREDSIDNTLGKPN